jgi:cell division protein FtsW
VLTFLFVWRGLKIAQHAPDKFGFLVASGISIMVGIQTFINIGVASGLLPPTGMTLPFISYGGSSLLLMFSATGILLNISKQASYERRLSNEFGIRLHRRVAV